MSAQSRIGDMAVGHSPPKTHQMIEGSPNVIVNGLPASRVSDKLSSHGDHINPSVITGSNKVFINGLPAARIGDQVSCGTNLVEGSTNVDVG